MTETQKRLCHWIAYAILLWLCIRLNQGCASTPAETGPLTFPFPDCEGAYADDIEPWTKHPDTGLCTFACISLGIARDKPIEEICANVGGVCRVNNGNNSGFCVQP